MSSPFTNQFRSIIQWDCADPEVLFEQWTENGDEIRNASKLIIGPGQGCIFVLEGRIEGCFTEEGLYDLKTGNTPFLTNLKNILYRFESYHKVGLYFFRTASLLNRRWGTVAPVIYQDPHYQFPVGLGAYGNFSFSITKPETFFRNVVAGAPLYTVKDIQKVLVSRITQPLSDYLANASFSYTEIHKHRNGIAAFCTEAVRPIFEELGFQLLDLRIEGTSFDEDTRKRIDRITDMSAEAKALKELGVNYVQHQQLQAMRDLARNEGQGNTALQMGMGLQAGQMLGQLLTGQAKSDAGANDLVAKLEKLKQLHDMGLINEQEYNQKKQELLSAL